MAPRHSSGGYRKLAGFQLATIIYDATVKFSERHLDPKSRLIDQMVQAARSGRQNLAEGSRAGSTNPQSEVRLTNVARASLEELLLDYEDFLRQHDLPQWLRDSPEALAVRSVWREKHPAPTAYPEDTNWRALDDQHRDWYAPWLGKDVAAIQANALICLINQANYFIDRQIATFGKTDNVGSSSKHEAPLCPVCGSVMVLRQARSGTQQGRTFWGCPNFPTCNKTLPCR